MKKLLFTAIAVIGFGMNSWGHTVKKERIVSKFKNYYKNNSTSVCHTSYEINNGQVVGVATCCVEVKNNDVIGAGIKAKKCADAGLKVIKNSLAAF